MTYPDPRFVRPLPAQPRSVALSYVLFFLLGGIGGHRIYNGRVGSGLAIAALSLTGFAYLLPAVLSFAWLVLDLFLIPAMTED